MKMYWFIFNADGEIISDEYETEQAAEYAMENGGYYDNEIPAFIDWIEI